MFAAFTLDLWSRPGFSAAFMGITCHFFDPIEQKLNRLLLACRKMPQPHTAKNVLAVYNEIIAVYEIEESKVFRIITDNGANIVKAFRFA